MIKTPDAVLKEIMDKKISPVYLLHGEESFFIDKITDTIEQNALEGSEKAFNQYIFYGKDVNSIQILGQSRQVPMMGDRQLVLIKEAQQISDFGQENNISHWENYLTNAPNSTILVFAHKHKTLNKSTKIYKLLEKNAVVIESKKIYDNQVPAWIVEYLKPHKREISAQATQLLLESLGADLGKIAQELDKLMLNVPAGTKIDPQAIETYIGISKEYNIFEFQKAISERNALKIQQIIRYWQANPKKQSLIPTLATLFGFFSKALVLYQEKSAGKGNDDTHLAGVMRVSPFAMRDYKVLVNNYSLQGIKQIIAFIAEADLQSKGIVLVADSSESVILSILVEKILNVS